MKKYIKLITVLVIVMSIYTVGVVIISKRNGKIEQKPSENNLEKDKENSTKEEVVQGDYVFALESQVYLNYKDGEWYEYPQFDYANKPFDVYVDNSLLGKYNLNYGGRWYIYDDRSNYIDYDGLFMAVYSNMNYSVVPTVVNQFDIVDQSNVNSFLSGLNITFDYNNIFKSKVLYDVNKDGLKDTIYFVSNAFQDEIGIYNSAFAYVFVKYATGDVKTFYSFKKSVDDLMSMSNPSFGSIIDIDGKQYLFVLNEKNSGIVNYYIYNMSDSFKLMYNTNIK